MNAILENETSPTQFGNFVLPYPPMVSCSKNLEGFIMSSTSLSTMSFCELRDSSHSSDNSFNFSLDIKLASIASLTPLTFCILDMCIAPRMCDKLFNSPILRPQSLPTIKFDNVWRLVNLPICSDIFSDDRISTPVMSKWRKFTSLSMFRGNFLSSTQNFKNKTCKL
ncbi:hypothetical protein CsSME_00011108 [Camellia sinensis var. sinensis]